MSQLQSARSITGAVISVGGEVLGLLVQFALVWIGAQIIWGSDDDLDTLRLIIWCAIASLYLGLTILALSILVRLDQPDPPTTRVLIGHPLTRFLSTVLTLGASALGLTVALELIASIGSGIHDTVGEFSAVWAMLLSWSMFNWGYARIYFSRYHRASEPPLVFPGTNQPRLVDFVYFSFTNATAFAVSDVQVVNTHMRWTVVWHTTLAFFFNALIIVLTMNVLANGRLFAGLLD